jgi:ABC-type multidrug transport system fused ATPase/permease subunit
MGEKESVLGLSDALGFLNPIDKFKLLVASLVQILLSLVDLLGIAMIGLLISLVSTDANTKPATYTTLLLQAFKIENFNIEKQIIVIGCAASLIFGLKSALTVFILRKVAFFLSKRSAEMSKVLISKLLSSSLTEIQVTSTQRSLFAITLGLQSITLGVISRCVGVVGDFAILITVCAGLLLLDPAIALASAIIFGSLGFALYLRIRKSAKNSGKLSAQLAIQSNQELYEILGSFREIYVKNRGNFYAEKIGASRLLYARNHAEISLFNVYTKYIMDTSVTVGALVVAMFQLYFVGGAEAIASLGLFLAAGLRIAPSVLRLQHNLIEMKIALSLGQETLLLHKRLINLQPSVISIQDESTNYKGFDGTVKFKNVNFTYTDSNLPALRDVTFFLPKGTFCGIVGSSGAGKSTLVDTMLGILKPDNGQVFISGFPPSQAICNWPGAIGYVPQDVQIIQGTIRENLTLGYRAENFADALLWEALKMSRLDDFVKSQPLGLNSLVGDKGSKLSGGQKQRLGIARAILSKPQLLILDEVTSALDLDTEKEVMLSMQDMRGRITLVVISHRLSTLETANVILEIKEGIVKISPK